MDFGRPHRREPSVATKSNIRIVPTSREENNANDSSTAAAPSLDERLIDAANEAAVALLLGPPDPPSASASEQQPPRRRRLDLANCNLYPERVLPPTLTIQPHSLVVIFESFDSLSFVYATPGSVFHNRNGHFHHDDFLGKPFGCKVRSRNNRGLGFVHLLRPTAELWARSLNHRTQIVHELDASVVVFQLNLRPNMIVCESGTGSGAMSHAILRCIAPGGMLHTYEFNKMRADRAREEFKRNGVDHLVTVHYRDVCAGGGDRGQTEPPRKEEEAVDEEETSADDGDVVDAMPLHGGFGLGPRAAHAVFLDLPEPWLAVPHAAHVIKPNGRIASYSPCVEQSQKTIEAMRKCGFHSIKTVEVRLKEHYVDEVEMELPPKERLPRESSSTTTTFLSSTLGTTERSRDLSGDDTGAEADNEKSEAETDHASAAGAISSAARAASPATDVGGGGGGSGGNGTASTSTAPGGNGEKRRKVLVARPFATMRGHTAFLTFATAGNRKQPDPNMATELEDEKN